MQVLHEMFARGVDVNAQNSFGETGTLNSDSLRMLSASFSVRSVAHCGRARSRGYRVRAPAAEREAEHEEQKGTLRGVIIIIIIEQC